LVFVNPVGINSVSLYRAGYYDCRGQRTADDGTGLLMKLFIPGHNKTPHLRLVPSIPVTGIAKGPVLYGQQSNHYLFLINFRAFERPYTMAGKPTVAGVRQNILIKTAKGSVKKEL